MNKADDAREQGGRTVPGGSLWGAKYAATFVPTGVKHDADGNCRDSRGEVVDCNGVPDGFAPGTAGGDSYEMPDLGQCILKCLYHLGPHRTSSGQSSGVVSGNNDVLNIPIPTQTVNNSLYRCPKYNNGFPFLGCSLEQDGSEKCQATCVYDGTANPLKPRPNPSASGGLIPQDVDPKSFAYTTYEKVTTTGRAGCGQSQRADPLVVCEVQL